MEFYADSCRQAAVKAREALEKGVFCGRLLSGDHTLWKESPREISDRLGWLECPLTIKDEVTEWEAFAQELRAEGFAHALLLGMGGSSLAAEVMSRIFGPAEGFLSLEVLDSTDPAAVLAVAEALDLRRTVFIAASKSGGTVETASLMRYFYNLSAENLGEKEAGRRFVVITDPGSGLAAIAGERGLRRLFLGDPRIGGRYSALSPFGLVPAALLGMDIRRLLGEARGQAAALSKPGAEGPLLGAMLGILAREGRDKLTFVLSPALSPFGGWLEQLIAESTGKEGRGILPIVGETLWQPACYGGDRIFVRLRLSGERPGESELQALAAAGHPVIDFPLSDLYQIGAQFYLWEVATAAACWQLGVNPFDQPDVEAAKILARRMMAEYREKGEMPPEVPAIRTSSVSVYGVASGRTPAEALRAFLQKAPGGAYAALQAFLAPAGETQAALEELRRMIGRTFCLPVTAGFGPRFLHSTGQLHKGGPAGGLFLQFTVEDTVDTPIPDELGGSASSLTFGVLKAAQAFGDRQALINAGRRVLRFHFHGDPARGLRQLAAGL